MNDTINFTPEKVEELRKAYDNARAIGAEAFTFEGKAVLVSYAKYLLEYLDSKFKEGPNQ